MAYFGYLLTHFPAFRNAMQRNSPIFSHASQIQANPQRETDTMRYRRRGQSGRLTGTRVYGKKPYLL